MIEENSGPAESVPISEVSHLVSVPLSEVLLYFQSRITMLNKIRHLLRTHISCDLLLYGATELHLVTNYKVSNAVHEFISSTDRL